MPFLGIRFGLSAFACLLVSAGTFAQEKEQRQRQYLKWVVTQDTALSQPITSFTTADSGLWVTASTLMLRGERIPAAPVYVLVSDISMLQFRRRGRIGRTLLIVTPISLLFGALIGLKKEEPQGTGNSGFGNTSFSTPQAKTGVVVAAAVAGVGIGLIIGSSKEKVRIDGRQKRYEVVRPYLRRWEGVP